MTTQIKVSLGWYERIWTLLEVYEMIDTNFILQTTLLLTCAKRWSCFEVIVHDSWINIQSQNNLSRCKYHLTSLHFKTDLWWCNNIFMYRGRFLLYFNYILKIIYSTWRDLEKCLRLLFHLTLNKIFLVHWTVAGVTGKCQTHQTKCPSDEPHHDSFRD